MRERMSPEEMKQMGYKMWRQRARNVSLRELRLRSRLGDLFIESPMVDYWEGVRKACEEELARRTN